MSGADDKRTEPVDEAIASRARELFDESVRGLDGRTRSRLNQGRQRAIDELNTGQDRGRLSPGLAAAAAVALGVLAVVFWNDDASIDRVPAATEVAADFELLMEADDLEMLEHLEFYSWIDLGEADESAAHENVG